jgi:hypothetical protein
MNLLKRSQLIILMAAIVGTPWMLNSPTVVSASETADTTQPVPTPTTIPKPCKPTPPGSPFIDPFCSPIPPLFANTSSSSSRRLQTQTRIAIYRSFLSQTRSDSEINAIAISHYFNSTVNQIKITHA